MSVNITENKGQTKVVVNPSDITINNTTSTITVQTQVPQITVSNSGVNGADGTSGTSGTAAEYAYVYVAEDAPTAGTTGKLWFNSNEGTLYVEYEDENGVNWIPTNNLRGDDGTSGTSATSGTSGSSGSSGTSFYGVTSGSGGTSGSSGTNGSTGSAGTTGSSGSTGSSGTSGTTGSSGTSGSGGSSGSSGTSGSDGTSGTSGKDGTDGTSAQYAAVYIGENAPNTGTNGKFWWNSNEGTLYIEYFDGNGTNWIPTNDLVGADGTSGVNGTSGTNGSAGTSGLDGTNGSDGTSGINGTSGIDGTNGTAGSGGTSGTNGTAGSGGTSGVDGTNGSAGTSGINGTNGSNGTSGVDGTNGSVGTSGVDGTNGTAGSGGTSGIDGTNGLAGTSGLNGDKFASTSTTSHSIGTGNKTFTIGTGLQWTPGQETLISYDGSNYMIATVLSYNSGTGQFDVNVTSVVGSGGPYTSWYVNTVGAPGQQGSNGTSGSGGSSGTTGSSGIDGTDGSAGTSGSDGSSGINGTNGTAGSGGSSGTTGSAGTSGSSGANGISGGRVYFFNNSQNSDVSPYKVLTEEPTAAAQQIITKSLSGNQQNVLVQEFITPQLGFELIPAGIQNFYLYGLKPQSNDDIRFYVTLQLADSAGTPIGGLLTSGNDIIDWTDATTPHEVNVAVAFPTTQISATNRMIVKIYVNNNESNAKTFKFYTEDGYYSFVQTSVGVQSGSNGTAGSGGTSGTTGSSGTSAIGSSGTSGINGTSGVNGTSGINGVSGTNGTAGSGGTSGINGTNGTAGSGGTSGINGTNGVAGANGTNGTAGSGGTSGINGVSGTNGTAGSGGTSGLLTLTGTTNDGIITLNGTAPNGTVESNLTFDGSNLRMTGSFSISGSMTIQGVNEKVELRKGVLSGTTLFDYTSGSIFYVNQPGANTTWNITNVPTIEGSLTSFTILVLQNAVGYSASAWQINSSAVTPKWPDGIVQTGSANVTDSFGVTAIRSGSTWNVLASLTHFY